MGILKDEQASQLLLHPQPPLRQHQHPIMHVKVLLLAPTLVASVLAIGRECCCDRYSEFSFPSANAIVAHCKQLWADVNAGKSTDDYCSGVYCVQQDPLNPANIVKCADAALQCGMSSFAEKLLQSQLRKRLLTRYR